MKCSYPTFCTGLSNTPHSQPTFILSLSKRLQGFSFENHYTTTSCWDYTNNLIIARQYIVLCSNTTTQQQRSPGGQFPFTACRQKQHKAGHPLSPSFRAAGGLVWSQDGFFHSSSPKIFYAQEECKVTFFGRTTRHQYDSTMRFFNQTQYPQWATMAHKGLQVMDEPAARRARLMSCLPITYPSA